MVCAKAANGYGEKNCKKCPDYADFVCGAPAGSKGEEQAYTFHNECFIKLRNCQQGQSKFHIILMSAKVVFRWNEGNDSKN